MIVNENGITVIEKDENKVVIVRRNGDRIVVLKGNNNMKMRTITKEDLISYFIEYLKHHIYFNSKNVVTDYLKIYRPTNYQNNVINILKRKISRIINETIKLGYVIQHNQKTYKLIKPIDHKKVYNILIKKVRVRTIIVGV